MAHDVFCHIDADLPLTQCHPHQNLPEDQCIFIRGFRVRKRMIWRPRLKAAAGPNPDPKDDNSEPDAELIPIPAVSKVWLSFRVASHRFKPSKYRDPLHVILEYITEVRAVCMRLTIPLHVWCLSYYIQERPGCDMAIVHDDDLAQLDLLGDGVVSRNLRPYGAPSVMIFS